MQQILCGQIAASGLQWVHPTWKALLLLFWLRWFSGLSLWPFLVPVQWSLISSPSVIALPHLLSDSVDTQVQPQLPPRPCALGSRQPGTIEPCWFSPSASLTHSAVLVQFSPLWEKQGLFLGRRVVIIPYPMYGRIPFSDFISYRVLLFSQGFWWKQLQRGSFIPVVKKKWTN